MTMVRMTRLAPLAWLRIRDGQTHLAYPIRTQVGSVIMLLCGGEAVRGWAWVAPRLGIRHDEAVCPTCRAIWHARGAA